ncbi:glycosyltransferase [Palleronia pontilimi]|uniref:glycosyltransferase n=1 Tax=Palleronia pontilimi TaxID=1964209 RepID=UPI001BE3D5B5|nr:glycosyltransferase [Palleronia pontilimi]
MVDEVTQHSDRLVAVVVTHDRLQQLKITVARLLEAAPDQLAAVLVVDNASRDGTGDWLAGRDDARLHVLRLGDNRGGAGGFAAGIEHALSRLSAGWIALMDDDARPEPGALAAFHAVARDRDTAYAGAVRYPSGDICEMNRPGLNPFARPRVLWATLTGGGRNGYQLDAAAYDDVALRDIDMGSFVGLFLPKTAIRAVGLPDPALFLYGDDVIYSLRLRKADVRILFDPALRFEHDCATYVPGQGAARIRPLWKAYYLFRNRLIMYRHAAGPLFWLFGPVLAAKWRLDARHYGADAPRFRRVWACAVEDGMRGRTGLRLDEVRALAD